MHFGSVLACASLGYSSQLSAKPHALAENTFASVETFKQTRIIACVIANVKGCGKDERIISKMQSMKELD